MVHGRVDRRRKRMVGQDEPKELIEYQIGQVVVQQWSPKTYLPIGEVVHLSVQVSTYMKGGSVRWTLMIVDEGEDF
jgi:hypothetical protein